MFTFDELASYLEDDALSTNRGNLVRDLTLGIIYELIPQAAATASTRAKAIAIEVAARALRNAEGYAQERIDDYTYQRPATTQEAGVYLTEQERYELLSIAAAAIGADPRSRVRSIGLRSRSMPYVPDTPILPIP